MLDVICITQRFIKWALKEVPQKHSLIITDFCKLNYSISVIANQKSKTPRLFHCIIRFSLNDFLKLSEVFSRI